MVEGLTVAALVLSGAPPMMVALAAVVVLAPTPLALVTLTVAVAWARVRAAGAVSTPDAEAAFLRAVAAELSAGAGLRAALDAAGSQTPGLGLDVVDRLLRAGAPIDGAAEHLGRRLPVNGRGVAAALRLVATTGARAAAVFARLAERASDESELIRERRVASAQARLSAAVVAGTPVLALAALAASGRLGGLFEAGAAGWLVLAVGLGLEVAGVAIVGLMLRRGRR